VQGFLSHDQTTLQEMFRVDAYVTAPLLNYDVSTTDFGSTTPTSIEVSITAKSPAAEFPDTVLLSTTGAPGSQFAGFLDLTTLLALGEDVIGRFASFRVAAGHTGGVGNAAGLRLNKPFDLRLRA